MDDYVPLKNEEEEEETKNKNRSTRLASLDVFRGLSVFLMIFVDYAGSLLPFISHSPWNGVRLADFVMPFFLFISGVSLALVYKKVTNRVQATCKAVLKGVKLFLLGVLLQESLIVSLRTINHHAMKGNNDIPLRLADFINHFMKLQIMEFDILTFLKRCLFPGQAGTLRMLQYVGAFSRDLSIWQSLIESCDLHQKFSCFVLLMQVVLLTAVFGFNTTIFRPIFAKNFLHEEVGLSLPLLLVLSWLGGYFHGLNSLIFGIDIESIRWFGILQRISIGYIVAALCEIWFSCRTRREVAIFKNYYLHWCIISALCIIHSGLLYGLYVPDWQFKVSNSTYSQSSLNDSNIVYTVKCAVRGDIGPACNSAGMIDRYVLGINHLYKKPVYRNLKECSSSKNDQVAKSLPSWCYSPFDPEGILSSLTAAVSCIIGLQFGHVLVQFEDHKGRLFHWILFSATMFGLGLVLNYVGIPLNKSLYTISYMLLTSASSGFIFCALYVLVDVRSYRLLTSVLEWMGKHSLSIFVIVTSNLAVIAIQGFYRTSPENNIIQWIVTRFVHE